MFATPKRWLEDGKSIAIERAPTAFGRVSVTMTSKLGQGEVVAAVELPSRNPATHIFLRARVPEGWAVQSARIQDKTLPVDEKGTVNLSGLKGKLEIHFQVAPSNKK
jgi:hypothetical protein